MNDPHVVALIYHVVHDQSVDYKSASCLCYSTEQFRICVADGTARFELKEHFATKVAAREVVDPYIRKWEFETGLRKRPDQFRLHFGHAEIIDLNPPPPPPGTIPVSATFSSPPGTMSVALATVVSNYPAPPSECAIDPDDPDVATMYHRYERYRLRRELLPSMAFFCLTMFESRYQGRRNAAKTCRVDVAILHTIGKLTEEKGGTEARKAKGAERDLDLTRQEKQFLEQAIEKIIFRVAQVAADENQCLPKITLSDLPSLSE